MATPRYLQPPMAPVGRHRQEQEAKEMDRAVVDRARRYNLEVPPYDFLELIGKGAFGRVFKCRRRTDQKLVAVKIIDIGTSDHIEKEEAIKDFVNETNILQTLKDAKAVNVNLIHDAFSFHSQLWIVSEYCPGGSVHTLMKACHPGRPGLSEKYIIAIARELAIALKHVHDLNVIHRDVKAGNILISQDGQLQLCDFGVSGVLESNVGKRSTIIGTPFWMAPEMHQDMSMPNGYGTEVDCWAFGCTIYELATGLPPNARIHPNKLGIFLQVAPRLEGEQYSQALKDFVSFCLEERPEVRPTANDILNHPYIKDNARTHPTILLKELIEDFARWEASGGQRASLFNPYGAQGPTALDPSTLDDDWNFSTTVEFDRAVFGQNMPPAPSFVISDVSSRSRQGSANPPGPFDGAQDGNAAIRGGSAMAGIFNPKADPYGFHNDAETSDLPLRKFSADHSANRLTMIDLDTANDLAGPSLDLAEVPTVRPKKQNPFFMEDEEEEGPFYTNQEHEGAKRLTKEWTFPKSITVPAQSNGHTLEPAWSMADAVLEAEAATRSADDTLLSAPTPKASQMATFRPHLMHSVTEPLGVHDDFLHPFKPASRLPESPTGPDAHMNNHDFLSPFQSISRLSSSPDRSSSLLDLDIALIPRPSTAASSATDSAWTDFTTGDPWDLDGDLSSVRNRQSYHMHSQSEPTAERPHLEYDSHHDRGGSLSSENDFERGRPLSVKASAESLRMAVESDDGSKLSGAREEYWDEYTEELQRTATRRAPQYRHQNYAPSYRPLLSAPLAGNNWNTHDSTDAYSGEKDRPLFPLPMVPRVEEPTFSPAMTPTFPPMFPTTNDSMSGSTLRSRRSSRGRPELDIKLGERLTVEGFPEPRGPDPAALEEDAALELVAAELDRLLNDFAQGLRISGQLLSGGNGGNGVQINANGAGKPGEGRGLGVT